MSQRLEFIICTERGVLEQMSKLLVLSIRNLGGKYSDVPIYSYQPRKEGAIHKDTIDFFEANEVHYLDEPLNTKYKTYPLANKPLACAHRAQQSSADYLVFLDSDTCFLREPTALDALSDADVAVNPTDLPNIATDVNFVKGEADYWRQVYRELGVERRKELKTTVSNEKILEYYNSGFIFSKKSTNLFQKWNDNFERIMSKGIRPAEGPFFTEQSVFSATVAQLGLHVTSLGDTLNYPVTFYTKKWRGLYPFTLKEIAHIHYHKILNHEVHAKRLKRKIAATQSGKDVNTFIDGAFSPA